jgi:uncharacterized protein YcbX
VAALAQVTRLAVVPVKGARLVPADALEVTPGGVPEDRAFFPIGEDGQLLSSARTPELLAVVPAYDRAAGTLRLAFPDGTVAEGVVPEGGEAVQVEHYDGRPSPARVLAGPWGAALSAYLGRPARLAARTADGGGWDDGPLTLASEASLAAVAGALPRAGGDLDGARFRATITIRGVDAWAEEGWCGGDLEIGSAVLRADAPVPRCVVTTRDPASGRRDHPVLKALAQLRGKDRVHFAVWLGVVRPGRIAVGDDVRPAA